MRHVELLMQRLAGAEAVLCLDGAQFDDLPADLAQQRISPRGLYRERIGEDRVWSETMPYVVDLSDQHAADVVFAIIGERPTGVVWVGSSDVLYRHLRSLNQIIVADRRSTPFPGQPDATERVVFRHADANVLAQVVPALDAEAFARLLGPADMLLYYPTDEFAERSRWSVAQRTGTLPQPKPGPLELDRLTLERIDERRRMAVRAHLRRHLRETVPDEMRPISDEALDRVVADSETSALRYGITSIEARRQWAWLNLVSEGGFARNERLRQQLTRDGARPDEEIAVLYGVVRDMAGGSP